MTIKIFCLIMSCAMVLSIVTASCVTKPKPPATPTTTPAITSMTTPTTKPTTTTTTSTTTTTGNWWDKFGEPKYGGNLYLLNTTDARTFDAYYGSGTSDVMRFYYETLSAKSWTVDPKIWSFQTDYTPGEYREPLLAESWEQPDTQTIIFHIRKGVKWQDKPPVNGRELTAYDIEYHYQRALGLGSGYTKPSPYNGLSEFAMIQSVTATDKYTVVFKSTYPTLVMMDSVQNTIPVNFIEAREVVEQYDSGNDWRHTVGTGPFILSDYVSGSSETFIKNPNYWGYDERHPENRLPYLDGVKILIIPDPSTGLAALRTGKIDLEDTISWTDATSLAKTNPEINQARLPYNGLCFQIRDDKTPFTDIRVRTALQMAIDLPTIAKTYYGGNVTGIPYPLIGPVLPGYYFPYDEWPQNLKDEYAYNPAGAKKLLAEAGYPNGFKTNVVTASSGKPADLDLVQIIKSYLAGIGVDLEIRVMDYVTWTTFTRNGQHDQMVMNDRCALTFPPTVSISQRYSTQQSNLKCVHDPVYDKMVDEATASLDPVEFKRLVQACDRYAIEHHWIVVLPSTVTVNPYQPWLKGYNGEYLPGRVGFYSARMWIDQNLKKSMGH